MINFFESILDFLTQAYNFMSNFVVSLVNATMLVSTLPGFITTLIGFVPPIVGASLTAVLGIGIVKLVLGWGNNQ